MTRTTREEAEAMLTALQHVPELTPCRYGDNCSCGYIFDPDGDRVIRILAGENGEWDDDTVGTVASYIIRSRTDFPQVLRDYLAALEVLEMVASWDYPIDEMPGIAQAFLQQLESDQLAEKP